MEAQPPLYLRGLDLSANYQVEEQNVVRSGLAWMRTGLDLYRLRPPRQNSCAVLQYVSKDRKESVLFAFRTHTPYIPGMEAQPPLYLRGLDPTANYQVEEQSEVRSGLAWMRTGLDLYLSDYQSTLLRIRQVE